MTVYTQVKAENAIHPGVMAEAERWLSRLEGGCALPADRQAFEQWRAEPAHAAAYAEARKFWDVFEDAHQDPMAQALIARTLADTQGRASASRFQGSRLIFALAASVIVCLIGAAIFLNARPAHVYSTEAGQRSTIQLDDGSQLILNSATQVSVKLTARGRQFQLKNGEAIFTVAQDPSRPFTVSAGDGEITSLGTRFQVRHDVDRVTVTLLEGRIALDRDSSQQHMQLKPGEQVKFTVGRSGLKLRTVDPDVVSSWTTGRLKFKATALAEVLEEVNRYSKIQIHLADPSLASTPVNATVEIGNSAAVILALKAMLPVDAEQRAANEIILKHRSQVGIEK